MTVRRLDRAVLVRDTTVVATGGHAVVAAQRLVTGGPVLLDLRCEVAERRRQAVGAVLGRHAAERPERVLQAGGERDEALALEHDMTMFEAAEDEPEMVEPVRQRRLGHRDPEPGHVGEVGQAHPARLVDLAEDHLALRAVQRAPLADAPLQRPPDAGAEVGMAAKQLLEHRDGPQAGARLQHGRHLGVEHLRQRIGSPPPSRRALLGGLSRVLRPTVAGGSAEPGACCSYRDRVGRSMLHEEPHLVIGHMAAGHGRSSETEKTPA